MGIREETGWKEDIKETTKNMVSKSKIVAVVSISDENYIGDSDDTDNHNDSDNDNNEWKNAEGPVRLAVPTLWMRQFS